MWRKNVPGWSETWRRAPAGWPWPTVRSDIWLMSWSQHIWPKERMVRDIRQWNTSVQFYPWSVVVVMQEAANSYFIINNKSKSVPLPENKLLHTLTRVLNKNRILMFKSYFAVPYNKQTAYSQNVSILSQCYTVKRTLREKLLKKYVNTAVCIFRAWAAGRTAWSTATQTRSGKTEEVWWEALFFVHSFHATL